MKSFRGITLIELIYTIAIIGILLSIATPLIPKIIDGWALDSTAKQMVEDIRWVQNLSTTEAISYTFELDVTNNRYRIKDPDVRKPAIKTIELNSHIKDINSNLKKEGSFQRLTYASTGIPTQTGSIVLTSKKGKSKTITIAVGTGRVTIKNGE